MFLYYWVASRYSQINCNGLIQECCKWYHTSLNFLRFLSLFTLLLDYICPFCFITLQAFLLLIESSIKTLEIHSSSSKLYLIGILVQAFTSHANVKSTLKFWTTRSQIYCFWHPNNENKNSNCFWKIIPKNDHKMEKTPILEPNRFKTWMATT
jgi:hypothetical protein